MEREAQHAHIGVAVLSPSFIAKNWPGKELHIMLDNTDKTEQCRFCPLFYKVHHKAQHSGCLG